MQATATLLLLLPLLFAALSAPSHGWGVDGHLMICKIAQGRLSDAAVKDLLPSYAGNDLSSLCSWADDVKFRYHWSSPLHYIDTPDGLCGYSYDRDCKDEEGVTGRCVAGAISNYTSQLLAYGKSEPPQGPVQSDTSTPVPFALHRRYTPVLRSHFMSGFPPIKEGTPSTSIETTNFMFVWDANIIQTAEDDFYGDGVADFIGALNKNITGEWSQQVPSWEECGKNPDCMPRHIWVREHHCSMRLGV